MASSVPFPAAPSLPSGFARPAQWAVSRRAGGLVRRGDALQQAFLQCCFCFIHCLVCSGKILPRATNRSGQDRRSPPQYKCGNPA